MELVEKVARALYRADVIDGNEARKISGDDLNLANVDLDKWFDTNATMPLSGQPFLRRWNALAEAAITALQATPAVSLQGWGPIETAPTGQNILVFTPFGNRVFSTYRSREYGPWNLALQLGDPTHWMPLPPPPEGSGL